MENLLKYNGRRFKADIQDVPVTGVIVVKNDKVYLANNIKDGGWGDIVKHFKYTWCVTKGSKLDLMNNSVTNFRLIYTKEEIEDIKEFFYGDVLKRTGNSDNTVVGVVGDVVFTTNSDNKAVFASHRLALYEAGWRLKIDQENIEEDEVKELTMDEIAKKFKVPVDKLKIKK